MKILISGKDSYIGDHIADWLLKSTIENFEVDFLDVRDANWENCDFHGYDAVVHVAGIVHRKDITDTSIYTRVNTELPVRVAYKAKKSGVRQFVFFSTMAVYGIGKKLKENYIKSDSPANPIDPYGESKYNAEIELSKLVDNDFTLSIVRPPNVYGKGCKGGYITGYASIVARLPVIPYAYANVKQSVLYIDNLCELIRLLLVNRDGGVFLPQDDKAVSAVELMDTIGKSIGMHRKKSKLAGMCARILSFLPVAIKGFGGVAYTQTASKYLGGDYVVVPFDEAIKRTV